MQKTQQHKTAFFIVIFSVLLAIPALAHSGDTDSSGGHIDHSTGEYHYHHGYPAHQHINGICPYDYDDRTGENSGTSSSSNSGSSSSSTVVKAEPQPEEEKESDWDILTWIGILVLLGIPVVSIAFFTSLIADAIRKKHIEKAKKLAEEEFQHQRAMMLERYGNKTINELAPIPPGYEIGIDGLPKNIGGSHWGETFTFYVSRAGKSFHKSAKCTKGATWPIHAIHTYNYQPCKRCKPVPPSLSWYYERKQILSDCEKYNIPLLEEPLAHSQFDNSSF